MSNKMEDVEHFPIPKGLLRAAGIKSDEDWDNLGSAGIRKPTVEKGEHTMVRWVRGDFDKALPQSGKEQPVKQAPKGSKATSKKQGAGASKPRYNYDGENKEGKKVGKHAKLKDGEEPEKPPETQGQQPTPEQEPEEPKHVDVSKLAGVLQTSIGVLRKTAKKFATKPAMKGRKGFINFMMTRCGRFAKKHKLNDKFMGLAYDALLAQQS